MSGDTGGHWSRPGANEFAVAFAERITEAMLASGLTREQICQALNIKMPLVNAWIAGRRLPSMPLFPDVCAVLNVDAHWLLGLRRNRSTFGAYPDLLPGVATDAAARPDDLDQAGYAYMDMAVAAWRAAQVKRIRGLPPVS